MFFQKWWPWITCAAAICCCFYLTFSLLDTGKTAPATETEPSQQEEQVLRSGSVSVPPSAESAAVSLPEEGFWLRSYKGKLAVYSAAADRPEQVLDFYVHLLPESDQEALETGVYAANRAELLRLIQDYTS